MIENVGILAAFGAMVCWGFGDFFIQRTTRRIGNIGALFFIGLFGSVALFPFILNELPGIFSNANILLSLFFLAFSMLVVAIINFQALKEGKISVVDSIIEFELPVTILFGMFVFHEQISSLQWVLSAFVFLGILLISFSKKNVRSGNILEKGVILAAITAFGMGFLNFFTASMARDTSPLLAIWSTWTITAVVCFAYIASRGRVRAIWQDAKSAKRVVIAESIFDTAAWICFAFAAFNSSLSITTAITESYPAIAIFLGVFVNRELVKHHQFLGMGLALCSSIALVLFL